MTYITNDWMDFAVCRGNSHLFFPPTNVTGRARVKLNKEALKLCAVCPVVEPCRDYGIRTGSAGIWGGETEEQRAERGLPVSVEVQRRLQRARAKLPN
jgi:WhiB family redox-sensing transcriptional regulator